MTIAANRINLRHPLSVKAPNLMRRLPPFAELVAFEAVARHLSFTRAAAELSITQSAISHRVRRLEKYFGKQLIQRLNPGLKLTNAGAELLPELGTALESLEHLNTRLGSRRERRLRVAAGSALCTWWLAGRLAAFMKQRPGMSVELVPIENDSSAIPEVDVRILWVGAGQDAASATQAPLFHEDVFPVCSPRLLPNKQPLRDVQVLGTLTLLHKATSSSGEWSWPMWLDQLGINVGQRRGSELRFADMGLTLSAAEDGGGVALSRSLLVHDALRSGRLIVPIVGFEPMASTKMHVARWRKDKVNDPDIEAFVTWLVAEAAITLAGTREILRSNTGVQAADSGDAANRQPAAVARRG
jgi:LysR family glycine cleavage system transcriptional activator